MDYEMPGFEGGYDRNGFDILGRDRDGFDGNGRDRDGLDRFGKRKPVRYSLKEIVRAFLSLR